jgi:hypothetical protein
MIQNGKSHNVGEDGPRYHTWPFNEKDIGFEDTIVISDECTPAPQLDGTSYTLWTTAHEKDDLYIDGERSDHIAPWEYFCILTRTNSSSPADHLLLGSQHVSESGLEWKCPWTIPRR